MALNEEKPVKSLVIDSSVLIRRAPIKDLTQIAYSVDGVVNEIKDSNTRASLQVLPFEFKLKQPSSDAIKFITNFSRRTGDYSNLSAVDLQLLALTYQLCKESLDEAEFKQLRLEPVKNSLQTPIDKKNLNLDKKVSMVGFYFPKEASKTPHENKQSEELVDDFKTIRLNEHSGNDVEEARKDVNGNNVKEEDQDEKENDEDDDGWINPSNLQELNSQSQIDAESEEMGCAKFKVACMTSDFSMQNVLIQIGIPVLSIDGLIIKKARNYVLKCITCKKITTNMEKQFCPFCGYKTLQRILMIVDSEGNKIYKERRKPASTKGLRFSLPAPHGGKHPTYPVLSEDQPRAQNFPSKKSCVKNDPLDPDYVCQMSPFSTRDVQSRASQLGIRGDSSRFNKR